MDEQNKKKIELVNLDDNVIEDLFKQYEFPGENKLEIETYLKNTDIPEYVRRKIVILEDRRHKFKIFAILAVCAFGLLLVLGANQYVAEFLFFFQGAVLLFATVALAAICLTGIIGILMNIDKKMVHTVEENLKQSGERLGAFFQNLFKM
jgi:hypothetical protein